MTAGAKRRVRVIVEGEAHDVSNKCGILRIDLPVDGETGHPAVVMVNPEWEGVTVEDVAPSYNWQDGDVVQYVAGAAGQVWCRDGGRWICPTESGTRTDGWASSRAHTGVVRVLRYQAGAA